MPYSKSPLVLLPVSSSGILISVMLLLVKLVSSYRDILIDISLNFFSNKVLDRNLNKHKMAFNLSHALQKLTSNHRNLQCLIAFAHSPRFEPVFSCQISIIAIPSEVRRTVVLPNTLDKWEAIIAKVVPPSDSAGGIWVTNEARSLMQRFGKHTVWQAPVHCECRLIEYLTHGVTSGENSSRNTRRGNLGKVQQRNPDVDSPKKNHIEPAQAGMVASRKEASSRCQSIPESEEWKTVPAFSYIGVSKLSCSACQMWIDGYNKRGGREFYTRGSHGKWYWPWALPRLGERDLSYRMVDQISTTYYEHCRAKGRLRCRSDGSNARLSSSRTLLNHKHLAFVTDYVSRMSL